MGLASQTEIDQATTVLSTGSYNQKLNFLRSTPINPPDGYTGMALTTKTSSNHDRDWTKLTIRDTVDMMGFIKMGAVIRDQVGALTFRLKFAYEGLQLTPSRAGLIPCWFLPWKSRHIMKLKIADFATNPSLNLGPGIDPAPNPDLFFTAAINGCSVFIVGKPSQPSAYHAGITGQLKSAIGLTEFTRLGGTSEAVWRSLLGRTATTAKPVGEVNRNDYVAQRIGPGGGEENRITSSGNYTTFQALMLESHLQGRSDLAAVRVTPWGCVFGLRDNAGNWSFNLVKNATVEYFRVVRKKKALGGTKTRQVGEQVPSPNAIRPDGTIDAALLSQLKVQYTEAKVNTCVNLGYQEFYPAGSTASYHDLGTINII
jgi:predicted nucleic-acid-binding Zn-ribbon protein